MFLEFKGIFPVGFSSGRVFFRGSLECHLGDPGVLTNHTEWANLGEPGALMNHTDWANLGEPGVLMNHTAWANPNVPRAGREW